MNEGDIALAPLPQADGQFKNRPVVLLRRLPPFGDFLVCGISTQLHQRVAGFDEEIAAGDPEFASAGSRRHPSSGWAFSRCCPIPPFSEESARCHPPAAFACWPTCAAISVRKNSPP